MQLQTAITIAGTNTDPNLISSGNHGIAAVGNGVQNIPYQGVVNGADALGYAPGFYYSLDSCASSTTLPRTRNYVNQPAGMVTKTNGDILYADSGNNCIRYFTTEVAGFAFSCTSTPAFPNHCTC